MSERLPGARFAQSCILSRGSLDPISARVQPFPTIPVGNQIADYFGMTVI
jgi:hypothetical protein